MRKNYDEYGGGSGVGGIAKGWNNLANGAGNRVSKYSASSDRFLGVTEKDLGADAFANCLRRQ